ncbi:T6SS amidase immunity protein Tai4 family protein [Methylomonas sp. AM2-LC]|uniref:T6SS amidase immunity protein Tai4 family protein n=1 Tax=Methylomonas sp. AM2-LC TaxID=3153301 RepID=UPI003263A783
MKKLVLMGLGLCVGAQPVLAEKTAPIMKYPIESYSQKTLLKNWALSVCLAQISKDVGAREDANATASAYLEFGRQRIEDYDTLRSLVEKYVNRKYAGSIKSDFNTMKCIDLFHSKELDDLASKFSKKK